MYEYTINAYNNDPGVGKINSIDVVVTAKTEEEARQRASKIVKRTNYAVTAIRELDPRFKKG